jgi:hypothetical protein
LLADSLCGLILCPENLLRVLKGQARDRRQSVATKRSDGLDVSENARAA